MRRKTKKSKEDKVGVKKRENRQGTRQNETAVRE